MLGGRVVGGPSTPVRVLGGCVWGGGQCGGWGGMLEVLHATPPQLHGEQCAGWVGRGGSGGQCGGWGGMLGRSSTPHPRSWGWWVWGRCVSLGETPTSLPRCPPRRPVPPPTLSPRPWPALPTRPPSLPRCPRRRAALPAQGAAAAHRLCHPRGRAVIRLPGGRAVIASSRWQSEGTREQQ